jgi:hypothetical protein
MIYGSFMDMVFTIAWQPRKEMYGEQPVFSAAARKILQRRQRIV